MKRHDDMTEAERDAQAGREIAGHMDGTAPLAIVGSREIDAHSIEAVRLRLGMTQRRFADMFGFSLGTLRHWEQQRRRPNRQARILLRIIEEDPERVARIAREAD